ncbi:MAG: glycosyltransferase family 1 protein [Eggerthellaceae bacterium]|nr:glycosyltransferase family 1 protein [Eggerthellaceae bacterium]
MAAKKRILFYSEGWGTGGIEAFVMNAIRCLDPDKFEFEIFCTHDYDDGYDEEISRRGGIRHVLYNNHKPGLVKRQIEGTREWERLLRSGSFDVVHINTMNGMGFHYAWIAEQCGIPIRIVHSHNTAFGPGSKLVKTMAHRVGILLFGSSATIQLACSNDAGRYLFGEKEFSVVPNAIDLSRFMFDGEGRARIRTDLGVPEGDLVVGFVGRLEPSKNPLFVLEVFRQLLAQEPTASLVLIGQGSLENEVSAWLEEHPNSSSSVIRVERTNEMASFLSSFDALCAPSLYEGNPVVLLEAQASGLPVIASDSISEESCITDRVEFLPLSASLEQWGDAMRELANRKGDRETYASIVNESGFGLARLAEALATFYELKG